MFVIPDVKIAVLFNPRTGSHTLHNLLWGLCRDRLAVPHPRFAELQIDFDLNGGAHHLHLGWSHMVVSYPDLNLDDYRAFAFYRHPESWFVSALRYFNSHDSRTFHPNMSPRAFWESNLHNMRRQTSILASREGFKGDIELFNYHDFHNELIRMFKELGREITGVHVDDYSLNNMNYSGFHRILTDKDKEQIRKYWWEDYHWLAYKGIDLPK